MTKQAWVDCLGRQNCLTQGINMSTIESTLIATVFWMDQKNQKLQIQSVLTTFIKKMYSEIEALLF